MEYLKALIQAIWVYASAGWIYIVLNAEVHPRTLPMELTHLTPWIREDTFGIICFAVSFIAFFLLRTIDNTKR